VVAIQRGQQIFNLAASFKDPEEGFEHQMEMPEAPPPEELDDEVTAQKKLLEKAPEQMRRMMMRPRPIEMRGRDSFGWPPSENREAKTSVWIRAREPIGDDPHMHQVVMAYASDMNLLSTAMRPHRVGWQTQGLQSASLDHAMWFHKPSDFNEWHLYVQDSPSASDARGFIRGSIFTRDGVLVASVAQEGLIRQRKVEKQG
jgi:acyl-CoA thioesterase-2